MDDEEQQLAGRIAELSDRVHRYMAASVHPQQPIRASRPLGTIHPSYRPDNSLTRLPRFKDFSHHTWTPHRGTPYGVHRPRGWNSRKITPDQTPAVKNTGTDTARPTQGGQATSGGYVTRHGRNMQLIKTSVYEQKVHERNQASIEEKRKRKEATLKHGTTSLIPTDPRSVASSNGTKSGHHVTVANIKFLVADGGNKLIRIAGTHSGRYQSVHVTDLAQDDSNNLHVTPKKVNVSGVTYLRTKHGNLYRAGMVVAYRSGTHNYFSPPYLKMTNHPPHSRKVGVAKIQKPCLQFSTSGTFSFHPTILAQLLVYGAVCSSNTNAQAGSCPKGPNCTHVHDPEKVAICKDFLKTGECRAGDYCDLSHNPTPERVPACLHFLRGNCTHADCRYAHVRVNPGAPVCKAFAIYGFCPSGIACTQRHVHECPQYANKGVCHNQSCHLPHVDRAGQLRKAGAGPGSSDEDDTASDISSDAEGHSDDVDSDEFDRDIIGIDANSHELSQQADYIKL